MSSKKLFSLPFRSSNQPASPPPPQSASSAVQADDRSSKAGASSSSTTHKPSTPSVVNNAPPPATPDRLIVGVDFGTTYSGYVFFFEHRPKPGRQPSKYGTTVLTT